MTTNQRLLSSIDLNWLSRHNRALPIPKLVVDDFASDDSGHYIPPDDAWIVFSDITVDCRNGVIVISGLDFLPSTIAHEWRHHWQWYRGWNIFDGQQQVTQDTTYKQQIKRYFRIPCENDALRFERTMYPDHLNGEWFDIIMT